MRHIFFTFFAIVLAYGPEWMPYYIKIFMQDEVVLISSLDNFETRCAEQKRGNGVCFHEYSIPASITNKFPKNASLGIGITLVATEIFCGSLTSPIAVFDDPEDPGRSYQSYNSYITFNLREECRSGIIVRTWAGESSTRHGLVGGRFTVGSAMYISIVKNATEFLTKDIRILVLLIFIFSYLVAVSSSRISEKKIQKDPFEQYYIFWIGFLFVSSGMLQLALPIHSPGFYMRLSALFSVAAHLGPILAAEFFKNDHKRFGFLSNEKIAIYCLSILVCLLPALTSVFGQIFLFCALAGLIFCAIRKDIQLTLYCFILVLSSLKLMNFPFTPLGHITCFYVAFVVSRSSFVTLKRSRALIESVGIGRRIVENSTDVNLFSSALSDAAKQIKVGRLTLMELSSGNDCNITYVNIDEIGLKSETFRRAAIPPIAAHAITTKTAVWHIDENSLLYKNIIRTPPVPGKYLSRKFCVVPLVDSKQVCGVVTFTNYKGSDIELAEIQSHLENIVSILMPYLIEAVKKRASSFEIRANEKMSLAQVRFGKIIDIIRRSSQFDMQHIYDEILLTVLDVVGTSGFLARVDSTTLKLNIASIAGYRAAVTSQYIHGTIIANPDNQHGPIPIAYHQKKTVVVSDIGQIENVLNPISLKLLKDSETGSIAAIPIMPRQTEAVFGDASTASEAEAWGLLWIEQIYGGEEITLAHLKILDRLRAEIENIFCLISDKEKLENANKAISGFMPKWAAELYLKGETPSEREVGFILMLDLRDSSKIALQLGANAWTDFVSLEAIPAIESCALKFGLKLHQVIWDAFYFSVPAEDVKLGVANVMQASLALLDLANNLYEAKDFAKVRGVLDKAARICFTHGDTSRGLTPGPSPTWSVLGSTMAIVSKLETVAKTLPGDVFSLGSVTSLDELSDWKSSGVTLNSADDIVTYVLFGAPEREPPNRIFDRAS